MMRRYRLSGPRSPRQLASLRSTSSGPDRRTSQPLAVLNERAVVVPGFLMTRALAYADLVDWWLVGHVQREGTDNEREGRLLTLHSRRPGTAPLTVFIDDRVALDPRVLERLELVKQANQGTSPLARLGT